METFFDVLNECSFGKRKKKEKERKITKRQQLKNKINVGIGIKMVIKYHMVNSLEFMSIVALQLIYQKILIKLFRKSIPEQVVFDESFIVFSTSADD